MIRVLIVDDSALVREAFSAILGSDPEIEVVGTAGDPFRAAERLRSTIPDVVTLDLEMPRMDGLTFLRKLMAQHPLPVVMCSTRTTGGSDLAMQAYDAGAAEVIEKPKLATVQDREEAAILLIDAVKAAAASRVAGRRTTKAPSLPTVNRGKLSADAMLPPPSGRPAKPGAPVLVLGASTGGTDALRDVIAALPVDSPGCVVVQHMPAGFTRAFADRLNRGSTVDVKEAEDGDIVEPGLVLIAPGGERHMLLRRRGAGYQVALVEGPLVSRHRPSVDVLFRSAAVAAGQNASAALLTGMGDDGAQGLLELRQCGAYTAAQDEATCVVYGMPREAVERGAAVDVLPLGRIAVGLLAQARRAA